MIPPPPTVWPQPDGAPVSCREKLRMLAENHAELAPGAAGCVRGCRADGRRRAGDAPHPGRDGRGPGIAEARRPMRLAGPGRGVVVRAVALGAAAGADHRHAADAATTQPRAAAIGSDAAAAAADAASCAAADATDLAAAGHRAVAGARQGECAECGADGEGRAGGAVRLAHHPGAGLRHPPARSAAGFAAFLTITDSHADAPGFRGWMLANNPSLSMLQHPIYDVRVVGCRA